MNKSIFNSLKRILTGGCVFYTVFMTITYIAGYFILENSEYLSVKTSFSFLLFALILSWASSLLFSDKLTAVIRVLIHFVVTVLGFYIIFIVGGGYYKNGRTTLVALILFIFAYIIAMIAFYAVRRLMANKKTEEEPYKPSFKKY